MSREKCTINDLISKTGLTYRQIQTLVEKGQIKALDEKQGKAKLIEYNEIEIQQLVQEKNNKESLVGKRSEIEAGIRAQKLKIDSVKYQKEEIELEKLKIQLENEKLKNIEQRMTIMSDGYELAQKDFRELVQSIRGGIKGCQLKQTQLRQIEKVFQDCLAGIEEKHLSVNTIS